MSRDYSTYESPFCTRYASKEMQYIFSADKKFSTWRRLWVALARAEMNLGIDKITQEMVDELESHITDINYEVAEEREKLVRHDVMSHVYAYGKQCPKAAGIIHLGATSCYVGDNTDVIIMRDALQLVKKKLVNVINNLAKFADEHKSQPCLAYTHLQPAQLTTVGKRASLWINELLMDYEEVEYRISTLKLLGQKGTTGTQASFVELFGGDSAKIKALEKSIANEMGFDACVPVSGQTYSRKMDSMVLATLGGIAQSCSKFSNDLRILANFKEMEEPFEKNQIGSSAMPYTRASISMTRIILADSWRVRASTSSMMRARASSAVRPETSSRRWSCSAILPSSSSSSVARRRSLRVSSFSMASTSCSFWVAFSSFSSRRSPCSSSLRSRALSSRSRSLNSFSSSRFWLNISSCP